MNDLEHLTVPQFDDLKHPDALKPSILHAKRSAALGVWLVATPAFFIACVLMKYLIGWRRGLLTHFESFWMELDGHFWGFVLQVILLAGFPLAALVMNVLAVLHVDVDKSRRELRLNIKLRYANLLLAALAFLILNILFFHLLAEALGHQAAAPN